MSKEFKIKKKLIDTVLLISLIFPGTALYAQEQGGLKGFRIPGFPFYIYHDAFNRVNNYIPSGWMGDWGDIKISEVYKNNPQSGKSCIQIKYSAEKKQGAGWAGIFWQNPPNNWGGYKGGFNLTGAKKIYFYSRGEKGEEYVEFKMGGILGKYSDSTPGNKTDAIKLEKTWKLYAIDLEEMDLSYVSGGFCVAFSSLLNPEGCIFYIDEVYYSDKDIPLEFDAFIASRKKIENTIIVPIIINADQKLKRVAVLSFENTSHSQNLEYLSRTISESISTFLAKEKDLSILDWNSVNKKMKALSLTLEDFDTLNGDALLGKILNVDTIIRGSFVEINNKIQINSKLVDVKSGTILASDQIQGNLNKDVFLLLDRTSQNILKQMANLSKISNRD
ncbi:MAG: FlgO family outer membrane protein [bacterium]|nr:FlgO family outer membrane protein [bacterium]